MRILMMSNTYAPVIGGIEQSIRSFSEAFRKQGHQVIVVAPTFEGMDKNEENVLRIPAIQNFGRSDISLTLPIPLFLNNFMKKFMPDIIHSHHFFGVGDMALRLARQYRIPLVFTHHIMLDQYADFFPIHNDLIKRFVLKLSTGYSNLSDCVIAPSQAVSDMLHRDGVVKDVHIIPTGVDIERFKKGNGYHFKHTWKIPKDAFVLGCVCRLNPEKNLEFLAKAARLFLKQNTNAYCILVGDGLLREKIKGLFAEFGVANRLICTGTLKDQELVDAYHAMDVFIFSSHSETQGLVLLEAMAAGTPVTACDAPAIRELIKDRQNGRLVFREDEQEFCSTLSWFKQMNNYEWLQMRIHTQALSDRLSLEHCAHRLMDIYEDLKLKNPAAGKESTVWETVKDSLKIEKELLINALTATEAAFTEKLVHHG